MSEEIIKGDNGLLYKTATYLKHSTRLREIRQKKAKQKLESIIQKKKKNDIEKSDVKRPEDFIYQYRNKQRNYSYYKNKKNSDNHVLIENDLVFVIRLKGQKNLSDNQKKLFHFLKLKKIHEARLFKINSHIKKALISLQNQIVFGKINKVCLKQLFLKRGYIRSGKDIIPMKSNLKIEENFQEFDILSVEDIVANLFSKNSNFEKIMDKICTFKLNKPTDGYGDKLKPIINGGAWGYNENLNDLVKKMI